MTCVARHVDAERTAARRAAITAAAAELIAANGFDHTTTADIARAAGVSSGTAFYYFSDKQAIFRSVFEADLPAAHEQVRRHADERSALAGILATVQELAAEARWPGAVGLMTELLRAVSRDPLLRELVAATTTVRAEGLAALVRRAAADGEIAADLAGGRAGETATWVLAVVDAAFLAAESDRDPVPHVRRIVRGYLTATPEGDRA